jgi:hypothetical protein
MAVTNNDRALLVKLYIILLNQILNIVANFATDNQRKNIRATTIVLLLHKNAGGKEMLITEQSY